MRPHAALPANGRGGRPTCSIEALAGPSCGTGQPPRSGAEQSLELSPEEGSPEALAELRQLAGRLVGTLARLGVALAKERRHHLLDQPDLSLDRVAVEPEVPGLDPVAAE